MIGLELILGCALGVAPQTIQAIVEVESRGNPLAIHVNGGRLPRPALDADDAAKLAQAAIAAGHSVDLGLMQINSTNLPRLGWTVEQMFDPCTNIAAGAAILTADYQRAAIRHGPGQTALRAALSAYNTGSLSRGIENGYVNRYGRIPAGMPASPSDPYRAETTTYLRRQARGHDPIEQPSALPPGSAAQPQPR
jgi:type IV secretion system protein VirB1